jgi:hypothetical protein
METIIASFISMLSAVLMLLWGWKSELKKERALKFYDLQFEQYNKLWSDLVELQIIADNLWKKAEESEMKRFVSQLKRTKNNVKKYSLIIEENNYQELIQILNSFENYQIGKEKLITSRYTLSNEQINKLIKDNEYLKQKYDKLLEKIKKSLSKQLKVY